jgi:hypothetical protein
MDKEIRPYEGRLKRIVLAYMPVAMGGAVATFAYDVGAHPGSSARDDPEPPAGFLPVFHLCVMSTPGCLQSVADVATKEKPRPTTSTVCSERAEHQVGIHPKSRRALQERKARR